MSHFSAHDLKVAFDDGKAQERSRILNLLEKWLDNDDQDLVDIWEEISLGERAPLTPIDIEYLDIGEI